MSNLKRKAIFDLLERVTKMSKIDDQIISIEELHDLQHQVQKIAESVPCHFENFPVEMTTKILDYAKNFDSVRLVCKEWNEIVLGFNKPDINEKSHMAQMLCWTYIRLLQENLVECVEFSLTIPSKAGRLHITLWMNAQIRGENTIVIFTVPNCDIDETDLLNSFGWTKTNKVDEWEIDISGALAIMPLIEEKYISGCQKGAILTIHKENFKTQNPDSLLFILIKKVLVGEKKTYPLAYGQEGCPKEMITKYVGERLSKLAYSVQIRGNVDITKKTLWSCISKILAKK